MIEEVIMIGVVWNAVLQTIWFLREEKNMATSKHPMEEVLASKRQVGGTHYQKKVQPWDYIVANGLGYLEGNIIKYVSRYKDKNGVQDLRKAAHYLEKLIEEELKNGK